MKIEISDTSNLTQKQREILEEAMSRYLEAHPEASDRFRLLLARRFASLVTGIDSPVFKDVPQ